jgi:hypothetical protein
VSTSHISCTALPSSLFSLDQQREDASQLRPCTAVACKACTTTYICGSPWQHWLELTARQVCTPSNLKNTALHCTALHCTALHCTALHCTALHCTAHKPCQPLLLPFPCMCRWLGGDKVPEYWGKPSPYTEGTTFLGTPTNHQEVQQLTALLAALHCSD